MSAGIIFILAAITLTGLFFLLYKKDEKMYSEGKINEIFDNANNLLLVDIDDYEAISKRKEEMLIEVGEMKIIYSRSPPKYSDEEIKNIENLVPNIKNELRKVLASMGKIKILLIEHIASVSEDLKVNEFGAVDSELISVLDNGSEFSDILDDLTKNQEFLHESLAERKRQLIKIEKSLEKYENI